MYYSWNFGQEQVFRKQLGRICWKHFSTWWDNIAKIKRKECVKHAIPYIINFIKFKIYSYNNVKINIKRRKKYFLKL